MSEPKTQPNSASVKQFIDAVEHPQRREDARALLQMMGEITGQKAMMWGGSIIGFGSYHFRYASGREGDWMRIGFSPRKSNISLYIMNGFNDYEALLQQLGKHKTGKSCLYINKLADIDRDVLAKLIERSFFTAKLGVDQA